MKKLFLSHSGNSLFQDAKTQKLHEGCFGAIKKRFLSDSEIWLFKGAKSLEIASKLFSRSGKAISFGFGKFTFYVAKTQEIALRLFCCHEKEISFGFGKTTFSERHNTENYFKVALTQRKREFIRFQSIWLSVKAISFGFGNVASSGLQR